MRNKYYSIIILPAIVFLLNLRLFAGADSGRVLFQDNFRKTANMNWGESVPGKKRKGKVKVSWVKNDGGGSALRIQINGFSGKWCGMSCEPFRSFGTGTIKVSFKVRAAAGKKGRAQLSTKGKHKWTMSKNFNMTGKYQLVQFSGEFTEEAAKKEKLLFKIDFNNNTDAYVKDVKIVME